MRKNTTIKALTTAAAAALVVTGCSNGAGGSHDGHDATSTSSKPSAQFNDADVQYAKGMTMHHEQAVEMSDIILEKSGIDPDVVKLAKQIKKAQGPEIKEMQSWLKDWGQDGSTMDHGGSGGMGMDHDGMLSSKDLTKLKDANGERASKLFLDQMIEHHQGAVKMAKEHRKDGKNSDAMQLSADVIRDQNAEIKDMRELRASL